MLVKEGSLPTLNANVSYLNISRSFEALVCYNIQIALKFDGRVGSTVVESPVKYQSDGIVRTQYFNISRLPDFAKLMAP